MKENRVQIARSKLSFTRFCAPSLISRFGIVRRRRGGTGSGLWRLWLCRAGRVEQFVESFDSSVVEREDFVEGGACSLWLVRSAWKVRVVICFWLAVLVCAKHFIRVERVEGDERFGFAVIRCCSRLGETEEME